MTERKVQFRYALDDVCQFYSDVDLLDLAQVLIAKADDLIDDHVSQARQ